MKRAGEQLALNFKEATGYDHPGAKGTYREESVRKFLSDHLPGAYKVATGFVFDARDKMTGQLDVLLYRVRDTPFLLTGDSLLVPCESLLAAIEIKSTLTAETVAESLKIASSIRKLKPFDKHFVDARTGGAPGDDLPRCMFSIFAFETDLVAGDDWLIREGVRFNRIADELSIPSWYVDRLIVLDRGIIDCVRGRGHDTNRSGQPAIQIWFVHLINHLLREDRRRKEIDIDIYTGRDRWMALPDWNKPPPAESALKANSQASKGKAKSPPQRKRRTSFQNTARPRRRRDR
jgi:hypothetical protein